MAARNVTFADDAIFHSDRGSNYTSTSFAAALAEHGVRQSVGRTGICYDNAMAESFFAHVEERACSPHRLPDTAARPGRHRPVHRAPLQHQENPLRTRIPHTARSLRRLAEQPRSSIRPIGTRSEKRGAAQGMGTATATDTTVTTLPLTPTTPTMGRALGCVRRRTRRAGTARAPTETRCGRAGRKPGTTPDRRCGPSPRARAVGRSCRAVSVPCERGAIRESLLRRRSSTVVRA